MEFFKVISVDETRKILNKLAEKKQENTEKISLLKALGRICARDILSPLNLPNFNKSTVDGYALRHKDVNGASESIPSMLDLIGVVRMGEVSNYVVKSGECAYVPTGGKIPNNADSVAMIEYSEEFGANTILIQKSTSIGENILYEGDDIKKDEIILSKGKLINSYDIGLLAGLGIGELEVNKKVKVAILSTGDEIIDIDENSVETSIRDINGYALYSLCETLGCDIVDKKIVKDNFEKLKETIENMKNQADLILMSGGSSVGTKDYTKDLIESFPNSQVLVHGIAIKPGKPTIIGEIEDTVIIGLPGHPVSSLIVFKALVESFIRKISGKLEGKKIQIEGILSEDVHNAPGRETYQMVNLIYENNEYIVKPIYGKSGMISLLTKNNAYICLSKDMEGIRKGTKVKVNLLQEADL
jgi:molybdopterin molybdotransferase